jgi:hypothetical protein
MKEKYLHYLWQHKLLPFHRLTIQNCHAFQIVYPGEYNHAASGPDFWNAKIKMDGILWIGDVEIHVRASDWFRHGHQHDKAYNQVILHVVYENDFDLVQYNRRIPAMEVKSVIEEQHYVDYTRFYAQKSSILCASQLKTIPKQLLNDAMNKAVKQRIERKWFSMNQSVEDSDPKHVFYFLLARAMGSKVNQLPFEELTQRLPFDLLDKLCPEERKLMLQYTSGLFEFNETLSLPAVNRIMQTKGCIPHGIVSKNAWKSGGFRPASFPTIRVLQFADFVAEFDFDLDFANFKGDKLLQTITTLMDTLSNSSEHPFSKSFKELIIINCFVPFLIWYNRLNNKHYSEDSGMYLLSQLLPEKNHIVNKWRKFEVQLDSALQSQGLIELYTTCCNKKKCLTCDIGIHLLNS